jgi:hypothetical protein
MLILNTLLIGVEGTKWRGGSGVDERTARACNGNQQPSLTELIIKIIQVLVLSLDNR